MDEALKKSGDWPNVAMTPGTYEHAATGEPIEVPESARIKSTEQSIENAESYDLDAREQPESVNNGDSYKLDTREQLEADIRKRTECSWVTAPREKVISWLDRQAEITKAHMSNKAYENGYHDGVAYAIEERDQLRKDLDHALACPDCDCCEWLELRVVDLAPIQMQLARFADEWISADTKTQEQRLIVFYSQQIQKLLEIPNTDER